LASCCGRAGIDRLRKDKLMTTRDQRLIDFATEGEPSPDFDHELLSEDHVGTYLIPFPCRRVENAWINSRTGEALQAEILGWRPWGWTRE
jgi:hypothetical protein